MLPIAGWNISVIRTVCFNGHPPLGVNATRTLKGSGGQWLSGGFNGHPPLGVNATKYGGLSGFSLPCREFQWAPTLGGECYIVQRDGYGLPIQKVVSMGTHPWG